MAPVRSRTIGYIICWSCQAGSRSRGGVRCADINKAILVFQVLSFSHLVSLDDDDGDSSSRSSLPLRGIQNLSERQTLINNTEAIKDERKKGLKCRIISVACLLQVEDILMLVWVIIPSLFSVLTSIASDRNNKRMPLGDDCHAWKKKTTDVKDHYDFKEVLGV